LFSTAYSTMPGCEAAARIGQPLRRALRSGDVLYGQQR
jgi:hypothetical protein